MGLEAATFIHQLVATNPVGATDPKSQGDDHIKLIKSTLQATFPNVEGAINGSHTQINTVVASGISGFAIAANPIKATGADAGVATTALRSDVQLVIDLADTYAWTGIHSFANNVSFADDLIFGDDCYLANDRYIQAYAADAVSTSILLGIDSTDRIIVGNTSHAMEITANAVINLIKNGTLGYISVNQGTTTRPGYIGFFTPDDTRRAFIGFGDGSDNIRLSTENNWKWRFTGDVSCDGILATASRANLRDGSHAVIDVPKTSGWERGMCREVTSGVTLNTSDMGEGYTFAIYNNSASAVTITQGSGVTLRLGGTTSTGNRSLAARGMASIWCRSSSEAIISGNVS